MPEMHLRQPQFTYSACGPFTKNNAKQRKNINKKFTISLSKLSRSSLLSIWYGFWDFKNLPKRQNSYKTLWNKKLNIPKNPKYYGYQCGLASLIYTFFDNKSPGGSFLIEAELC